ncbi:adrenodoxin-like protein 2, mitochondrial [Amyelois transitella]|uniref:adrenodoxin-like protein 2, mitochondrial n=1 Tax=Amyelois transitella TaxID=680683 RepID=UPI00299019BF|nr:adrenodoxin-like protein 2, mitochondrial [Amyelois transitella]
MFHRSLVRTLTSKSRLLKMNFGTNSCKYTNMRPLSTTQLALNTDKVKVTFVLHDGKRLEAEAKVGDTLLDVVVNNDLNIEGYGACEGTLTCSTCHVILDPKDFDRLPEEACEVEKDMLDLAYGLTDTSRLGCQITLTKDLDGLEVKVPETINDARS